MNSIKKSMKCKNRMNALIDEIDGIVKFWTMHERQNRIYLL